MSSEWIKFEKATSDKPEIHTMAARLGIDPDAVVGKCLRVWGWFDTHTVDGNAPVTVKALLDRLTGVSGFCDALLACGWMGENETSIWVRDYGRHNGEPSKKRAQTRDRVEEHRKRKGDGNAKGNAPSVTPALAEQEQEVESTLSLPRAGQGQVLPPETRAKIGEILTAYPKNQGYYEAEQHLADQALEGVDLDMILRKTQAIAVVIGTRTPAERLRIPAANTFFLNRRYLDDPATWLSARSLEPDRQGPKKGIEDYVRPDNWTEENMSLRPVT